MASGQETEIKLAMESAEAAAHLLAHSGFHVAKPRHFEANTLFDTPKLDLKSAGRVLRIREAAGRVILTAKGPATKNRHKTREELEVDLSDGPTACAILSQLGFAPVFRYEKYRTEYVETEAAGIAMLDETPIGVFLELEGEPDWIDRTAERLGLSPADYINLSYVSLYFQHRDGHPGSPADMVFSG